MKKFISRQEAADYLNVHPQTVSNWAERGLIKTRKIGRATMVDADTLTQYADDLKAINQCDENIRKYQSENLVLERELLDENRELRRQVGLLRDTRGETLLAKDLMWSMAKALGIDELVTCRMNDIIRAFINGDTINEIADRYDLTGERVRQIFVKACRILHRTQPTWHNLFDDNSALRAENDTLRERIQFLEEQHPELKQPEPEPENAVLALKLVDLGLSVRALNCLKAAEIETLGQLVSHEKYDLLKWRNFGKKSLTELDELITEKGLRWGMPVYGSSSTNTNK